MVPLSLLDLSPIVQGGTAAEALNNTLDLARHAERWGYRRYWLAEHHNMPGIASAATAVAIAHVAAGTKTIRVGSGGVMLPNHAPLVIAEQFGTLESLFPGRIDLGLGRTPGPLPPPVETMENRWTAIEQDGVGHAFREAIVGSAATVKRGIEAFLRRTGVDELMVAAAIFDHAARLRSFELVARAALG